MIKKVKCKLSKIKAAVEQRVFQNPLDDSTRRQKIKKFSYYWAKRAIEGMKRPTLIRRIRTWWYWKFHDTESYGIQSPKMTRIDKYFYWYRWIYDQYHLEDDVKLKNPVYKTEGCYDSLHLSRDIGRAWSRVLWKSMSKTEKLIIRLKLLWAIIK